MNQQPNFDHLIGDGLCDVMTQRQSGVAVQFAVLLVQSVCHDSSVRAGDFQLVLDGLKGGCRHQASLASAGGAGSGIAPESERFRVADGLRRPSGRDFTERALVARVEFCGRDKPMTGLQPGRLW